MARMLGQLLRGGTRAQAWLCWAVGMGAMIRAGLWDAFCGVLQSSGFGPVQQGGS